MKLFLFLFVFNSFLFSQISQREIAQFLKDYFSEFDDVEVELLNKVDLKNFELDNTRTLVRKSDVVLLPVKSKDNNVRSLLRLKIKLFKKVFLARQDIPFNTPLNKEDFNYALRDVTSLRGNLVGQEADLSNYKTKFNIKEGGVLLYELIEQIPIVKSGEKVVVEVIKGSVQVSSEGIARENGRAGEVIDVLTYNNEKLKAKVIEKNKVIVE
jgi:flagella basal body P-ring formation protein FlgA